MRAERTTRRMLAKLSLIATLVLLLTLTACDREDDEQAASLIDWSPDGSKAALVPDFIKDDPDVSGIWVYDFRTGATSHIFAAPKGAICTHPHWSPAGDEILFAMVHGSEEDSPESGESIAFSVYAIRADGQSLHWLADSRSTDPEDFLMHNAVSWGPTPGTILFQQSAGDRVTAMRLDLANGEIGQYLPDSSDSYSLEPSPDRRRVAALLSDKESGSARLYLADFDAAEWRFVETLEVDTDQMKKRSQAIYWSPDSSKFVVPEIERATADEKDARGYLRLFDDATGWSNRFPGGDSSSAIMWNRESDAFVFAVSETPGAGIYRADFPSGSVRMIVPGTENRLLSWNHQDGRIYFFRTNRTEKPRPADEERFEHRLFSCDAEGDAGRTPGRLSTSGSPFWNLSPDGSQMVLFEYAEAPDLIYLATGGADRIRLQSQPVLR